MYALKNSVGLFSSGLTTVFVSVELFISDLVPLPIAIPKIEPTNKITINKDIIVSLLHFIIFHIFNLIV
jgi:hypothetical protein